MKKNKIKNIELTKKANKKEINFNFFLIPLLLMILFSILLFKGSIHLMQDDADYLQSVRNFVDNGIFPTTHGTILYNIILSISVLLLGPSITITKILSFSWAIISFYFTYLILKRIVHKFLVVGGLFIYATNFAILYYSSSVLSESFFMMMQVIFLYVFLTQHDKLMSNIEFNRSSIVAYTKNTFRTIFFLFLLSLSKLIGIVSFACVIFYLVLNLKWKNALFVSILFGALSFSFKFILKVVFNVSFFNKGGHSVLLKDAYKPELGNEDLKGLISRVWENFDFHISCDLMRILGFRGNDIPLESIPLVSVIFLVIFLFCIVITFKNRKKLFFLGLYLSMMLGGIFLALQNSLETR